MIRCLVEAVRVAGLLCCIIPTAASHADAPALSESRTETPVVRAVTDKPFADVITELDFAITERNFRITGRNTIGEGLRQRGYVDFPNVEVIHFCNLEYAREVLLLDADFAALMPCRITVHEDRGKTVINLILLPENHPDPRVNTFAHRLNGILREILDYALAPD